MEGNGVEMTTKISFKVPLQPKKDIKKVETNVKFESIVINDDDAEMEITENRKRRIISLEDGVVISDEVEKKKEKKEYCINIEKGHDFRIQKLQKLVDDGKATEEEKARLALMIEAFGGVSGKDASNGGEKVVPSIESNIFQGSSEEADYSIIPVGQFGEAFLRGCGWKKEEGIGRTNKRVVPLHVSEQRPKGLGLGCAIPAKPPLSKAEKKDKGLDESETILKKNSFVKIINGSYKNAYAVVRSHDEDNCSYFVDLLDPRGECTGVVVRVSQFAVEPKGKREFSLLFDQQKDSSSLKESKESSSFSRRSPPESKNGSSLGRATSFKHQSYSSRKESSRSYSPKESKNSNSSRKVTARRSPDRSPRRSRDPSQKRSPSLTKHQSSSSSRHSSSSKSKHKKSHRKD